MAKVLSYLVIAAVGVLCIFFGWLEIGPRLSPFLLVPVFLFAVLAAVSIGRLVARPGDDHDA